MSRPSLREARRRAPGDAGVLCDVDAAGLAAVEKAITGSGGRGWAVSADVTKPDEVERMVGEARRVAGRSVGSSTVRGCIR